jgi:hypothetical protein
VKINGKITWLKPERKIFNSASEANTIEQTTGKTQLTPVVNINKPIAVDSDAIGRYFAVLLSIIGDKLNRKYNVKRNNIKTSH